MPDSSQCRLQLTSQIALASLLPLLLAGEASAAVAFEVLGRRRRGCGDAAAMSTALAAIAAEERVHEGWLLEMRDALPQIPHDPALHVAAAQFFCSLASRNAGVHFARIAALDSAVCIILGALRRAQPHGYAGTLSRIATDESRHVALSLRYARALTHREERINAAAATRESLATLLLMRGAAFEQLGIDTDRLRARISRPPRFLSASR